MEKVGTVELKELIDGLFELYVFGKLQAEDGIDWQDAAALAAKVINDDEFREKLILAFTGFKALEAEVKDLDFQEGLELTQYLIEKLK